MSEDAYAAEIEVLEEQPRFRPGRPRELLVRVRNRGGERFPWGAANPAVRLSYHWLARDGEPVVWDGQRTLLTHDLGPGGETVVPLIVAPPSQPGEYVLAVDLVDEGVRWFGCAAEVSATVERAEPAVAVEQAQRTTRFVCVTGMHRSGTSLVARLLNLLGADVGEREDLLAPAADNPAGFWEHREIVALNDAVLAELGGSAAAPPELPPGWERDPALEAQRRRAAELLARLGRGGGVAAWKDPRTSLTLPFWRTVAPVSATVLVVRHPLEVARSLAERDGTPEAESLRLYVRYVVEALRNDPACTIVAYRDAFDSLEGTADRLAQALRVQAPGPAALEQLRAAVDERLRHSRLESFEGEGDAAVAVALYRLLCADERRVVLDLGDALLAWAHGRGSAATGVGRQLAARPETG